MRASARMLVIALCGVALAQAQQAPPNPEPDSRYKVDILLVVGHPDDDILAAGYIARLIEQQHKRVAVLHATRGNSGGNAAGPEQASALADVREIEARHALASYGISDVWFLHGADTPGSDVLHSLEAWGHGQALEEVVRLVRLTRPEIVMTHLPDYVVGENHDDHQAVGVLATEAFDLAANPLAFPEQVEAPRNRRGLSNYGEGLRPWQPKKIYFFTDATHFEFMKGKGPEYSTAEVSPARKMPYAKVVEEIWGHYKTQDDFTAAQLKEFAEAPVRLIWGKSLIGGSPAGDVFEGVSSGAIAYVRPRGYEPPAAGVTMELGGPWAFYQAFWRAHNMEHLAGLLSPEAQVPAGETLWVPLILRNETDTGKVITVHPSFPNGWSQQPEWTTYSVGPRDSYAVQLTLSPPASQKDSWQELEWSAESDGKAINSVALRVNVAGNGLPQ